GTLAGGVTNSGTIKGQYGIYVYAGGKVTGGITNQAGGFISGSASAISLAGSATSISGGVTNSGTTHGGSNAIVLYGSSSITGGITNNSGAIISASATAGISLRSSSTVAGGIDTSGTIFGGANGIEIKSGSSVTGGITNQAGALITGLNNTGIVLQGSTADTVTNHGTIVGANVGIHLKTSSTITGSLTNTGIISGSSTGIYIDTNSDITGGIDNSGTIKGEYGLYLTGGGNVSGGIVNKAAGLISGSSTGLSLSGSTTNMTGDITNHGTIYGGLVGLGVYNSSTMSGGITNASDGLITGGSSGIELRNKGIDTGGIDNSGTIKGVYYGIHLKTSSSITGGITNEAGGLISGTTSTGIRVEGNSTVDTITNHGTIYGGSKGIVLITGGTITGNLTNSGVLSAVNTALLVQNSTISGKIDNSGTIVGNSFNYGIYVSAGGTITGGITNEAGGTISGVTAIQLNSGSTVGNITNSGLIKAADTGNAALYIVGGSTITNDIVNNSGGTISAPNETAIFISTGSSVGNITNHGSILGETGIEIESASTVSGSITNTGLISITNAAAIYVRGAGTTVTGGIDNSGTIKSGSSEGINISQTAIAGGITNEAGGTISGSATAISLINLSGSTPITLNGGRIVGNVIDNNPGNGYSPVTIGGNLATEGNFTVSNLTVNSGATFTISSGDTVTLNTMPASAGTISIGVDSTASHGTLTVTGGALDLSTVTISATLPGSPALTDGDSVQVASGTSITNSPGATPQSITDNSIFFDFQMVEGTYGALGGTASQLYFLVSTATAPAFTPNTVGNLAVYNTLMGLSGTADPQLSQILLNVGNASTSSSSYNAALSSLLPDMNGASFNTSLSVADQSQALISYWLSGSSGMGAGNNPMNGLRGWGQVFGQHAEQQTRGNIAGYRAETAGLAMGADTGDRYDWGRIGGAFTYGNTYTKSHNANASSSNIDSYAFTVYGQYHLPKDYYLRGMATYVRGATDTSRHDVGGTPGLTARGSFDSNQYTLLGMLAHDYTMDHGGSYTPHLLMDWTHYDPQDYTETGAGGANLHVNQKSLDMVDLGFGITAKWKMAQKDGATLTPQVNAGYKYDLVGDRVSATSTFSGGGAAFSSPGPVPARGQLDLGTGVTWQSAADWNLKANYDFSYRSKYTSHAGVVKFTQQF
ncbi:MAG: autotransporter domain-containing protein, partial [Alphaproteobacteria bacterium]|nr:autotransporter domain-containing protein [Alphaproteobacteria bacterium]